MGSSVRASCDCGYEHEFLIGGGMTSFHELCSFPCLCRDCQRVVQANLFQSPLSCPKCKGGNIVAYDEEELCEQQGVNEVTSWATVAQLGRDVSLTDGCYYCPSCKASSSSAA